MHDEQAVVIGGVDTHGQVHVAAAIDGSGRELGTAPFAAGAAGYRQLLAWLAAFGTVSRVGVEGTGCYGAGLARYLATQSVPVLEVNRPDRQARRRAGKSDPADARAAARAALNGQASALPKAGTGPVESLRVLRIARRSAMKARTQAASQIAALIVTAPEAVRAKLAGLRPAARITACAALRPAGPAASPVVATRLALRVLARRHQALTAEISLLDTQIAGLCAQISPALLAAPGVGPDTASALLITAGDNPHRLRSEASFAALCGVSPVDASSGKITRHRLNRGGDRQANNALWRIALVRLATDPRTQHYAASRQTAKTRAEIIRDLKRYIAREVYQLITQPPATAPDGPSLRARRTAAAITLTTAATALGTWPTRLSRLERGLHHDTSLATSYHDWLEQNAA